MNSFISPGVRALGQRLAHAWTTGATLDIAYAIPALADQQVAYAVQHETLKAMGASIGGWKVGAKTPDGSPSAAPLPAAGVVKSGTPLQRAAFRPGFLEIEIGFRFGKAFPPRSLPYDEAEVHDGIADMMACVELVSSRYPTWPDIAPLAALADLNTHGGLVVGEGVPYRKDFAFVHPPLTVLADGRDVLTPACKPPYANSAGDPRRLLAWLVNHCTQDLKLTLTPDAIVTTGTFTGMLKVASANVVVGEIAGLPPVQLSFIP